MKRQKGEVKELFYEGRVYTIAEEIIDLIDFLIEDLEKRREQIKEKAEINT